MGHGSTGVQRAEPHRGADRAAQRAVVKRPRSSAAPSNAETQKPFNQKSLLQKKSGNHITRRALRILDQDLKNQAISHSSCGATEMNGTCTELSRVQPLTTL